MNFGPLPHSENCDRVFKVDHFSRFCFICQLTSSGKLWSAEEVDVSFISITKPPGGFPEVSFSEKRLWERFRSTVLIQGGGPGINESTPQTKKYCQLDIQWSGLWKLVRSFRFGKVIPRSCYWRGVNPLKKNQQDLRFKTFEREDQIFNLYFELVQKTLLFRTCFSTEMYARARGHCESFHRSARR